MRIDLNCDAGENYGVWKTGNDEAMFALVSSVNIACGGHAGDHRSMSIAIAQAAQLGLGIGAHPSYEDKLNFGRRPVSMSAEEIETMVAYQVGGLAAIAAQQGTALTHVKAHGALANHAAEDKRAAEAIARATRAVSSDLILLAIAGTELQLAGERLGLNTLAEGYADRSYDHNGRLTPRAEPGAVVHDPEIAARRCVEMASGRGLPMAEGGYYQCEVQSICVHGDTPGAVDIAGECRKQLISAGFEIISFAYD